MKKMFIIFMLIILTSGLIGCSDSEAGNSTVPPSEAVESVQKNNTEEILSSEDTVPTQNATQDFFSSEKKTEPIYDTSTGEPTNMPTDVPTETPTVPPTFSCNIFYTFQSIKDMHTYVTTGSKNPEDYLFAPSVSWDIMLPFETLQTYGYYEPINRYFDINEEDFDYVEVGFSFNDDHRIEFSYFLDNMIISFEHVNTESILEHYVKRYDENLSSDKITTFSSTNKLQSGHVLRKTPNCDILYLVENGIKKQAHILNGNTYIMITDCRYYDQEDTITKEYEEFMTDPKTACFAALFSDDEEIFNQAITKFESVK